MTFRDLPCGLTRVTADLSPGDASTFRSAIEALARPRPGTTTAESPVDRGQTNSQDAGPAAGTGSIIDDPEQWLHGTGSNPQLAGLGNGGSSADSSATDSTPRACRDLRPAPKRRADALMELVNAAQRVSTNDTGRASARATVTVPLSVLVGSLVNAGFGTTDLGDVLDAGTARTMACSAQLVPMVLGSDSQPLDVGRASRTFTSSTRAAIVHRDGGCTYPGCDRPAPWCEAHHAVPWWVGGGSTLSNGVLLCSRHHHVVHSRGYLPRITTTGVTWALIPDEMPTRPLDPGGPLTHGPGGPPEPGRRAA